MKPKTQHCPNCSSAPFGADYPVRAHLTAGCWGDDGKTPATAKMLARVGLERRAAKGGKGFHIRAVVKPVEAPSVPPDVPACLSGRRGRKAAA